MTRPLVFTRVRVFDGSGRAAFPAEVRVEGQRIVQVAEAPGRVQRDGAQAEAVKHAATALGGELMDQGRELGQVRDGYLADLLLVDGDPTEDVSLLQDRQCLRMVMKDGRFHRAPPAWQA